MNRIHIISIILGLGAALGCAVPADGIGAGEEALQGETRYFLCKDVGESQSVCKGNGMRFALADLVMQGCELDPLSGNYVGCTTHPGLAPAMPWEFWSEPAHNLLDCEEGTEMVCEYVGEDVECWCEPVSGGGNGGGGGTECSSFFEEGMAPPG